MFFAIKDAIKSAREESGLTGGFRLDSPATAEKIRMACQDEFAKQVGKMFILTNAKDLPDSIPNRFNIGAM